MVDRRLLHKKTFPLDPVCWEVGEGNSMGYVRLGKRFWLKKWEENLFQANVLLPGSIGQTRRTQDLAALDLRKINEKIIFPPSEILFDQV